MSYSKRITNDGSVTYFNSTFDETMHSMSGAEEEARIKYAEVCQLQTYLTVSILDIGFGLGYNTAAALDILIPLAIPTTIIGLDNDKSIIDLILQTQSHFTHYPLIQQLAADPKHAITTNGLSMQLLFGDALETLPTITQLFDICFLDPFSPKKNPALWTQPFLRMIYFQLEPGSKLVTYSCARHVRDNLVAAGFTISDGPIIGRRGPSTIALKN